MLNNNDDLIKSLERMRKIHEESARRMSSLNALMALPGIKLPVVDFPKVYFPKVDFPTLDLPKLDIPKVGIYGVNAPKVGLTDIKIPEFNSHNFKLVTSSINCVPDSTWIEIPKVILPSINFKHINQISETSRKMLEFSSLQNYDMITKSMRDLAKIMQKTSLNIRKVQEVVSHDSTLSIDFVADIADFNTEVINHFTDDNADKINDEVPENISKTVIEMYNEIYCRLEKLEKAQNSTRLSVKNVMTWVQLIVYMLGIIYGLVSPGPIVDIDAHKEFNENNYYYIVQDTDNLISEKLELTKNATMEEFEKQNELPQIIDEEAATTETESSENME